VKIPDKKKAVYSAADLFMVTHAANILDNNGIETYIQNNFLSGAMGEIPVFECWPRLFVVNDDQYDKALKIVTAELIERKPLPAWICNKCQESNEGAFELCWSCGSDNL
jgi:hypothetical protein